MGMEKLLSVAMTLQSGDKRAEMQVGKVCKMMKVVTRQVQRGILKSHAQQLNKGIPKWLDRDVTLVSHIQQLWVLDGYKGKKLQKVAKLMCSL